MKESDFMTVKDLSAYLYNWRNKGASMEDILEKARVRPTDYPNQQFGLGG